MTTYALETASLRRTLWILSLVWATCLVACSKPATTSDAGTDAGPGKGDAGVGLTCATLLTCDQKCGSSGTCTDMCYADTTAIGQGLFNAFDNCISANCSSADGGPCASPNSTECSNCNQSVATGACIAELVGCEHDNAVGPPDPDGGAVAPDAGDGETFNCGQYLACVETCPVDAGSCATSCSNEATPTAVALAGVLNSCLAMACPSTDGGPCEMPGLACNGCIEQVELAEPDTCAAPYIACNSDTSNSPDGGDIPTVLVDGGVLSTVLTGLDQCASTMVVGGDYLYFTQVVGGSPVLRIALSDLGTDGGTYSSFGPPQPTPVSLAVDSNNVYVWSVGTFALGSSVNNTDGTLVQLPLDGGAPITLAPNIEVFYDAAYLNAVAIDSHNVYWVAGAIGDDGSVMKAPIGGATPPVALYPNQYVPQALATDGTNVYWTNLGTFDATGRSNNDGTVWQGPVEGGTPKQLASNQEAPYALAVDATTVYWADLGPLGGDNLPASRSGSILKTPIGGGTVTTVASEQAVPVAILVSGGTIYWSEYGLNEPGLIMSAPAAGGPLQPLVTGLNDPAELVIAGDTLFWTNANSSPNAGFILSLSPF